MADYIDFEDLISLNEIYAQKENKSQSANASKNSQEPLSAVLDQICETVDVDKIVLTSGNVHELPNGVFHNVELDEFEKNPHEGYIIKDTHRFRKMKESEIAKRRYNEHDSTLSSNDIEEIVNITDISNTGLHNNKEKTINKHKGKENEEIDLSPTSIGLAEFQKIYNETCIVNCKNIFTSENDENTVSLFTNLNENSIKIIEEQYEDTIINLDEFDIIFKENDNLEKIKETITNHLENGETENYNSDERVCAVIDSNIINLESNGKSQSEKYLNDNIEDIDMNLTKPNVVPAIKEELKYEVSSHFKTIKIDLADDDTISISSESDDGYNSSDFEFITESEAKRGGMLVNSANNNIKAVNTSKQPESKIFDSTPDYIKYHKNRYTRNCATKAKADRESHVIPEGEGFLDLFRGVYSPMIMNGSNYSSNKHVLPAKSMTFNTDGFGFDLPPEVEENPEFKTEAYETVKKIRFLYPDENRKRRRL